MLIENCFLPAFERKRPELQHMLPQKNNLETPHCSVASSFYFITVPNGKGMDVV